MPSGSLLRGNSPTGYGKGPGAVLGIFAEDVNSASAQNRGSLANREARQSEFCCRMENGFSVEEEAA
ncbi:hypothetical protein EDM54_13860 [Brevibacillus borstelensis]|nr:hypothetical protein EDM54_13860 [Brevibacillus borstelensis]